MSIDFNNLPGVVENLNDIIFDQEEVVVERRQLKVKKKDTTGDLLKTHAIGLGITLTIFGCGAAFFKGGD